MYHVAYCFDAKYQQHFAASAASLVANFSAAPSDLTIHVVTDSDDASLKQFVVEFTERTGASIELHRLTPEHVTLLDKIPEKSRNMRGYLGIASYFRIMLPMTLGPDIEKVLYLDCDTIIVSDVVELLTFDLGEKAIGAALDFENKRMAQRYGLPAYYNSGVMLMNLSALRRLEFSRRCFEYKWDGNNETQYADQCAINIVMKDDIKVIPENWNRFVTNNDFSIAHADETMKGASIFHFITGQKPWHAWYDNKIGGFYWSSVKASGWRDPVAGKPVTVAEHHRMARKLSKQGKFADAISIYETLVTHLRTKTAELRKSA